MSEVKLMLGTKIFGIFCAEGLLHNSRKDMPFCPQKKIVRIWNKYVHNEILSNKPYNDIPYSNLAVVIPNTNVLSRKRHSEAIFHHHVNGCVLGGKQPQGFLGDYLGYSRFYDEQLQHESISAQDNFPLLHGVHICLDSLPIFWKIKLHNCVKLFSRLQKLDYLFRFVIFCSFLPHYLDYNTYTKGIQW